MFNACNEIPNIRNPLLFFSRLLTIKATFVEELTGVNVTAEATVNIYVMRGSIKLTTVYGFPEFYEGEDVVIKVWVTVDLFAVFCEYKYAL